MSVKPYHPYPWFADLVAKAAPQQALDEAIKYAEAAKLYAEAALFAVDALNPWSNVDRDKATSSALNECESNLGKAGLMWDKARGHDLSDGQFAVLIACDNLATLKFEAAVLMYKAFRAQHFPNH